MSATGPELVEVASGLQFPEGPVAYADGSVVVVEMFGQRLTRVHADGRIETIAEVPGGPNGAATGPDGLIYVCNNGGSHTELTLDGLCFPGPVSMDQYIGGSIQTVDPSTGVVRDVYTECDGNQLASPNDIVFDAHGGFYVTDLGFQAGRVTRAGGIYYGLADGSSIVEVAFPVHEPNGVGLSPDGNTLYWSESYTGRVIRRDLVSPGRVRAPHPLDLSMCLHGFEGYRFLDSLAVEGNGNVCVATCITGGIGVIDPCGGLVEELLTDDYATTNICFGGDDLTTAYITMSGTGRLLRCTWPRPGLALHHQDR